MVDSLFSASPPPFLSHPRVSVGQDALGWMAAVITSVYVPLIIPLVKRNTAFSFYDTSFLEHLHNSSDGTPKPLDDVEIAAGAAQARPFCFCLFWLISEAAVLKGKDQIFCSWKSIKVFLGAWEGNWLLEPSWSTWESAPELCTRPEPLHGWLSVRDSA